MRGRSPAAAFALIALACCNYHDHPPDRDVLESVVGTYHLDGVIDAYNVQLHEDGSYHGSSFGCDFWDSGRGRWEREGLTLRFLPESEEESADVWWPWFGGEKQIVATLHSGGFVVEEPGGDEQQIWTPGGVCAECGGGLAPSGLDLCDDPYGLDSSE